MAGAIAEVSALFCRMRVARLAADGTTPAGATNMFVTDIQVEVNLEPDVQQGQEISEQTGCGNYAVPPFRLPDYVKWRNGTLTMAYELPEFEELTCGGSLITSGGNTIGYAEPPDGLQAPGFGVSMELWAERLEDGFQAATNPWIWTLLARTYNWRKGPRRWFLGVYAPTYLFQVGKNVNIGNGPNNDWPGPSDRPMATVHSAVNPPAASLGYLATPAQV